MTYTEIVNWEMKRKYSDDLAKLYYALVWLIYGIYWIISLQHDPVWQYTNAFFQNFDLIFLFWLLLEKSMAPDLRPQQHFMEKPAIKGFSRAKYITSGIFVGSIVLFLNLLLYHLILVPYFAPIPIASISNSVFLLRGVPPEEFVFRGFMMSIIFFLLTRSPTIMKKFKEGNNKLYHGIWIALAIGTGLIFGLYHLPTYYLNNPNFPYVIIDGYMISAWRNIIYIIFLGVILGLLRHKYGLLPCIYVHTVNNFISISGLILNVSGLLSIFIF